MLNEADHLTTAVNGITADFFHQYPDEFEFIENYVRSHRRAPSKAAFRAKFPGTTLIRSATDVAHFCEEVKNSHAQAEFLSNVQEAIDFADRGDLRKALRHIQKSMMQTEVSLEGMSGNEDIIRDWATDYAEAEARVQRSKNFGQAGIPTGFHTLDERTGGPQPGQFWVISARLGEGKTWTLNRMATAALFGGFNVQYNALEMTRAEIAFRVHTFASSVYGKEVFKNMDLSQGRNFDMREYKEFLQGLSKSVKTWFRVADQTRGAITLSTMAAQCERNKPDISYLDYITLLENDNPDMRIGLTRMSAGIKQMAGRYGIPFVVAAQLNRNAAGRRELSGPEDLAESDSIGRDADVVVTMKQMSKRVIAMKLAKHRHGRSGFVWYNKFLPNTGHFEEITFDAAQEVIAEDKSDDDEESALPKQRTSSFNVSKASGSDPDTNPKRIVIKKKRG
ncbi:DnaB-like helicase C-terminal domain-containing protein [Streptomyces sp. NPDC006477]|uniref:DnaB-like helicase C-terminal domain-containing protein n=1 Tax=Streptomyces sp. NPDC006477 TaxID=3364747 RepID=UPI00367687EB